MKLIILIYPVLLVALFFRLSYLDRVPPGLANDEINIILNAQSLVKTGEIIPGFVMGVFGSSGGDLSGGVHSELSSLLIAPFLILLGISWPAVKLPFVLASMGLVILSYFFVKELINEKAGLIAGFLVAVNPWSVQFGRSAYEAIFSCIFYLVGIYLLVKLKNRKLFWTLPFFLMGFLSYFSAKVLLLPIILTNSLYKIFLDRNNLKPVVLLNVVLLIFVLVYGRVLVGSEAGIRLQEIKNVNFAPVVNEKRTASMDLPGTNIYENKLTENLRLRLDAALGGLSPSYLFINGQPEPSPHLSLPDHGPLFLIDLPLIVLGLISLVQLNLATVYLFLGLIATTLVPNFLNLGGTTYVIRTVILFPILVMLSAIGVYFVSEHLSGRVYKKLVLVLLTVIYLLFVGNFSYHYFARLPIDKSTGFFVHRRLAIRYAALSLQKKGNRRITIVTTAPKHTYYTLLLFANAYKSADQVKFANAKLLAEDYTFGEINITNTCPQIYDRDEVYLVDTVLNCHSDSGKTISSIKDGGGLFDIVNDHLCGELSQKRYPLVKNYSDLRIENLSREQLCEKYIIKSN